MKAAAMFVLTMLVVASARADWKDLRPGMNTATAVQCVGFPLLQSRGKAAEMWNYDRSGCLIFERGRLAYWTEPRVAKPVLSAIAQSAVVKPKMVIRPANTVALRD